MRAFALVLFAHGIGQIIWQPDIVEWTKRTDGYRLSHSRCGKSVTGESRRNLNVRGCSAVPPILTVMADITGRQLEASVSSTAARFEAEGNSGSAPSRRGEHRCMLRLRSADGRSEVPVKCDGG